MRQMCSIISLRQQKTTVFREVTGIPSWLRIGQQIKQRNTRRKYAGKHDVSSAQFFQYAECHGIVLPVVLQDFPLYVVYTRYHLLKILF